MTKAELEGLLERPPVNPDEGPWLIWSHYWGRWHRRSEDGGASGYTDDIARAGVFDFDKARAYHDREIKHGRNEAIPAARTIVELEGRLESLTAERDAFAEKVEQFRAAIASARRTGPPLATAPSEREGSSRDHAPSITGGAGPDSPPISNNGDQL